MEIFLFYGAIGVVWAFYRAVFRFPEAVDELLVKPLLFLLPVLIYVRLKEKKDYQSLGFTKKNLVKNLLIGFGLGLLFAAEGVITSALKYKGLIFNPQNLSSARLLFAGFLSLATGFTEEILNRGFLMNRLWQKWGNEIKANLASSLCFALMHLPAAIFVSKYRLPYDFLTYELSIFVLAVADGYIFARTKSIFAPTVSHALWNWSCILFK